MCKSTISLYLSVTTHTHTHTRNKASNAKAQAEEVSQTTCSANLAQTCAFALLPLSEEHVTCDSLEYGTLIDECVYIKAE